MSKLNSITTKRFVIRKTLIGTDTNITFTNKKVKRILTTTTKYILPTKKDSSQCLVSNNTVTTLIVTQCLPSLATYH